MAQVNLQAKTVEARVMNTFENCSSSPLLFCSWHYNGTNILLADMRRHRSRAHDHVHCEYLSMSPHNTRPYFCREVMTTPETRLTRDHKSKSIDASERAMEPVAVTGRPQVMSWLLGVSVIRPRVVSAVRSQVWAYAPTANIRGHDCSTP